MDTGFVLIGIDLGNSGCAGIHLNSTDKETAL